MLLCILLTYSLSWRSKGSSSSGLASSSSLSFFTSRSRGTLRTNRALGKLNNSLFSLTIIGWLCCSNQSNHNWITHKLSFGSGFTFETSQTRVSLHIGKKHVRCHYRDETKGELMFERVLRSIQSDLQTVPLAPEILWLPVVQVGHGGQGNQELQQYQRHPVSNKKEKQQHLSLKWNKRGPPKKCEGRCWTYSRSLGSRNTISTRVTLYRRKRRNNPSNCRQKRYIQ